MNEPNVPSERDVREIVLQVTSTLFNEQVELVSRPHWSAGHDELWTGCVTFDGSSSGAIAVTCPRPLVNDVANLFFGRANASGVPPDVAVEALAELTNIVGGNVKALFSSPDAACTLSLPIVASRTVDMPGTKLVHELWCTWHAMTFGVLVYAGRRPVLPRREAVQ